MRMPVVLLVGLAVVMLTGGAIAFSLAPEGANAATALIVPAACAVVLVVCAVLSALLPRSRAAGMIGIHAGLVFTLLFAAAIGHRAYAAWGGVGEYRANVEAHESLGADAPAFGDWAGTDAAPHPGADHDKTYLAVTLSLLSAASLITFGLLIANRPKPGDRGSTSDGSSSAGSTADGSPGRGAPAGDGRVSGA